ncbi:MAG: hypothetical protein Q8K45_21295 [Rubrivivax sp.]|nr:hypothetical protein [Rubrivivax sp.]
MTPHAALIAELYLVATNAEAAAVVFRAAHGAAPVPFGRLEDHRTQVLGDLLDAIESVEPGLGKRLHDAMDPIYRGEPAPPLPQDEPQPQPASPVKTSAQVLVEMAALEALKPTLRRYSVFRDDNHRALEAQLQVLVGRLDAAAAQQLFGADEPHVLDHALHAAAWLTSDIAAPSQDWKALCKP